MFLGESVVPVEGVGPLPVVVVVVIHVSSQSLQRGGGANHFVSAETETLIATFCQFMACIVEIISKIGLERKVLEKLDLCIRSGVGMCRLLVAIALTVEQ